MVVNEYIVAALRKAGIVDATIEPTAEEMEHGLLSFNTMVSAMRGEQIGPKLSPRPIVATSITAYNGARYMNLTASSKTLNTPMGSGIGAVFLPKAGSRFGAAAIQGAIVIQPNGVLIEGDSDNIILNAGESGSWYFEDETSNWVRERDLALLDEVEFSDEVQEPLIDLLTVRVTEEYGPSVTPEMQAFHQQGLARIARRYGSRGRNMDPKPNA